MTLDGLFARCTVQEATNDEYRCLCVAFNKWATDEELEGGLRTAQEGALRSMSIAHLTMWHWLGRAAVCRGGRWTSSIPAALVGLVASAPEGVTAEWLQAAARGVEVVMQPPSPDLPQGGRRTPGSAPFAAIVCGDRPATRAALAESGSEARRAALLQALTYCLVATPQATLLAEPATAMPYLLQWLQVATQRVEVEDGLLCSVLAIVSNLIKGVAEDEPLGDIVPTLLVLVERELAPETMEACLDCLDGARGGAAA